MTEFYVGYLPIPPGIRRFALALVACGVIAIAGLSLVLAQSQRDPGDAMWDDRIVQFEGMLIDEPYPALIVDGDWQQMLLLVASGKRGTTELTKPHLGQTVRVHGTVLERGVTRLLEISDDPNAIEVIGPSHSSAPNAVESPVAKKWHGEIIDPKCYCGAMKPGEGKTHKACAALCLRGGIPPMFVRRSDRDHPYLLVNSEGKAFSSEEIEVVIGCVGDEVVFSAQTGAIADCSILSVDLSTLRRE